MLENMTNMLIKAKEGHYAIPQFNINNLEWTRFVLEACEERKSPVILGVSEGAAKYMGGYLTITNMVKGLVKDLNISIPVAIHLDHASSFESCKNAIDAGFTSVMIDASKYELPKNIEITKMVVDYAHPRKVTVEAEIGHVGGQEDGIDAGILYADVNEAVKLAKETGIDFLAPALGSVHGLYASEPKLDFERMQTIANLTNLPLVLHGGTGIPDDMLIKAVKSGICKINFNTELQIDWAYAVRLFLDNNKDVYDPRKIIKSGENSLKNAVNTKINILGSSLAIK